MRILALSSLLILSSIACQSAAANAAQAPAAQADAQTRTIDDPDQYLAEIDQALALAVAGEYGTLKRGSENRLRAARDRIADLLEDHSPPDELPSDDRIAIHNAQEVINSILRNQDKSRVVCQREEKMGSRLPVTECMTIAQREARALAGREATEDIQRIVCYPGEGQSCNP